MHSVLLVAARLILCVLAHTVGRYMPELQGRYICGQAHCTGAQGIASVDSAVCYHVSLTDDCKLMNALMPTALPRFRKGRAVLVESG